MSLKKVIIVGGMPFNVPPELKENFEIVGHITQDQNKIGRLPSCDLILAITDWVAHSQVKRAKDDTGATVVWVKKGWPQMRAELMRRHLLADPGPDPDRPDLAVKELFHLVERDLRKLDRTSEPPQEAAAPEPEPPTTVGLDPDELWNKYGADVILAARMDLEPQKRVTEAHVLRILCDLVGLPVSDMKLLLPELAVRGIVVSDGTAYWLASTDTESYQNKDAPLAKPPKALNGAAQARHARFDQSVKNIVGLPMGPYPSKAALAAAMGCYKEFLNPDGTTVAKDTAWRRINRAIELRLAEEHHGKIYVDHNPAVKLTRQNGEVANG